LSFFFAADYFLILILKQNDTKITAILGMRLSAPFRKREFLTRSTGGASAEAPEDTVRRGAKTQSHKERIN
jgi:hypothetical protein